MCCIWVYLAMFGSSICLSMKSRQWISISRLQTSSRLTSSSRSETVVDSDVTLPERFPLVNCLLYVFDILIWVQLLTCVAVCSLIKMSASKSRKQTSCDPSSKSWSWFPPHSYDPLLFQRSLELSLSKKVGNGAEKGTSPYPTQLLTQILPAALITWSKSLKDVNALYPGQLNLSLLPLTINANSHSPGMWTGHWLPDQSGKTRGGKSGLGQDDSTLLLERVKATISCRTRRVTW